MLYWFTINLLTFRFFVVMDIILRWKFRYCDNDEACVYFTNKI